METVFSAANALALAGWLALLAATFLPRLRSWVWPATGIVLPLGFALAYGVLLVGNWGVADGGGFGSLAAVGALFQVPALLTAGWLHYLAFDLFVGTWIARDGSARGVPRLALVPCFALTFMAGPLGLLLYIGLRSLFGGGGDLAREARP